MQRRSRLQSKSPLRQGTKGLTTRRPLERRTELKQVSDRRLEAIDGGAPARRRRSTLRHGGFTPASPEQRAKVKRQGCRITAEHGPHVHPMHVTDRALAGCDHEDCVVGGRADYHRLYDMEAFDLLPYLTKDEQAHAVSHLGILGALQAITGTRWAPADTAPLQPGPGEAA